MCWVKCSRVTMLASPLCNAAPPRSWSPSQRPPGLGDEKEEREQCLQIPMREMIVLKPFTKTQEQATFLDFSSHQVELRAIGGCLVHTVCSATALLSQNGLWPFDLSFSCQRSASTPHVLGGVRRAPRTPLYEAPWENRPFQSVQPNKSLFLPQNFTPPAR